jgi:hypothetical protein
MKTTRSTRTETATWLKLSLGFTLWTLLGFFDATETYLRNGTRAQPVGWWQAVALGLALWYAWAILSVFIVRFTRRYPIEHRNWAERVVLHLSAGAFFAMVKLAMDYPIIEIFYCPAPGLTPFMTFYRMGLGSHFHVYLLIYWAIVGTWHASDYYLKYRDREQKSADLGELLGQAKLQLLKSQIQPHFLFNTLNVVTTLIHKDVKLADRMLVRLGELMRASLDNFDSHEVTLRQELDFTAAYLEIEQVRFGKGLQIEMAIDDQALDAKVPFLLLQPLVENSILHGIRHNGHTGRIIIRAELAGKSLRLTVEDSGRGATTPADITEGIGLGNTRARLVQLYGEEQQLEFSRSPLGGLAVTVDIPLSPQNSSALACL